jgi:hypothetical protein
MADLGFSHSYFSCLKYQEPDCESITKVVVFSTTNPTKFSLNFSEFFTIFYTFYKFQQMGYTIEDAILRSDPWKDLGPRNWVPRPTERWARWNPEAPVVLPTGERVGVDHMLA